MTPIFGSTATSIVMRLELRLTENSISDFAIDFAIDFANELLSLPAGSQVNIVSHSLGGVIVREMLRLKRTDLDTHGINFGQIVTMGTPNAGTWLADPFNIWAYILTIIVPLVVSGDLWPSPVFWSLCPGSSFMNTLNQDPPSYSDGIRFTTAAAHDYWYGLALTLFHHVNPYSDPIVTTSSVHSIDAWNQTTFPSNMFHPNLVNDEFGGRRTYNYVGEWLNYGDDSDGDGLLDDEESYYYGTNPDLYDTDGDGLSDGAEVNTYGTDPNYWNTDNDAISDGNEVSWGYDPLDANSPIPASSLISSVSVITSSRTVKVYVNHYPAMDYVKFYVKYKTKFGSWTSYSYMGIDYSPLTGGDYYRSWTHPTVYTRMMVMVKAYDSDGNWLGSDYHTSGINPGGGGGGGGGDPPPIE